MSIKAFSFLKVESDEPIVKQGNFFIRKKDNIYEIYAVHDTLKTDIEDFHPIYESSDLMSAITAIFFLNQYNIQDIFDHLNGD